MFTKKFFYDLLERTIATAAQAFLAVLTTTSVLWGQKLQIVGVAALAAILKGLAATRVGASDDAAMLPDSLDSEAGHYESTLLLNVVALVLLVLIFMKVFEIIH